MEWDVIKVPVLVAEITTVTKGKTRRKKMHISVSLFTKILFTYKNKTKENTAAQ